MKLKALEVLAERNAMTDILANQRFMAVVNDCLFNRELIQQFDRLQGLSYEKFICEEPDPNDEYLYNSLDGERMEAYKMHYLNKFIQFVYDFIWTRLPEDTFELLDRMEVQTTRYS